MSWAIVDTMSGATDVGTTDREKRLRDAIQSAVDKHILLFCANPDRGPGYGTNVTYPKSLKPNHIFCIGAATQDGLRWGQIDTQDTSCNYFLPGVELGIQVESTTRKNLDEPPHQWCVSDPSDPTKTGKQQGS